jgi:hypothetical protein
VLQIIAAWYEIFAKETIRIGPAAEAQLQASAGRAAANHFS